MSRRTKKIAKLLKALTDIIYRKIENEKKGSKKRKPGHTWGRPFKPNKEEMSSYSLEKKRD